ncbi:ImmA/IrrE family metallo-endopeptidase [Prosthecobacter fluviatilis]|uniref:ImmA/IrrE family metallo-endopeptidase n=1 Tax=Prosthecobacter fluviatilis TaxID=445931 RepID=A0ABW0KTT4_9BACT
MTQTELPFGAPDEDSKVAAIDQLIRSALNYNTAKGLRALLDFASQLPAYSPFNCLLLHIQNSNARFVAPPEKWHKLKRTLKPGARPLVILAPMRPVMFVFDVTDTEGGDLPLEIIAAMESSFDVQGEVSELAYARLCRLCTRAGIAIEYHLLHPDLAGAISPTQAGYEIRINATHSRTQQFATIAHELGHLFCGHLGRRQDGWWPERSANLDLQTMELEAEAVAWLVCQRFRVMPASACYLSGYLQEGTKLPVFSLDAILVGAGAIEEMAKGQLPARLRARKQRSKSPSKP